MGLIEVKNFIINSPIGYRVNTLFRKWFILSRLRKRLKASDITILCNNCNGGFIYHDLNLEFKSPTINMYFIHDHFFYFCENLESYLKESLVLCENPINKSDLDYPICNIGDGIKLPKLELHFLHYKSFMEANDSWERRKKRINFDKIFIIWTFFDKTDESWLRRFDKIPQKNKIAFCESPFPQYKSCYYIKGYEGIGLGVLSRFDGLSGHRIYDNFDFVSWFNSSL